MAGKSRVGNGFIIYLRSSLKLERRQNPEPDENSSVFAFEFNALVTNDQVIRAW